MGPSAAEGARRGAQKEVSPRRILTEEEYGAAVADLRSRLNRQSANPFLDPAIYADLTRIGGYHFEKGVRNFSAWSARMVQDYGKSVRPYLADTWRRIQSGEHQRGPAPFVTPPRDEDRNKETKAQRGRATSRPKLTRFGRLVFGPSLREYLFSPERG